jgi:hypothetical protein
MRLNADVMDDLFGQFTMLLAGIGELSCENIFIDGTKLEAFPNRYKFVWKKSVEKQSAKMREKMKKELPVLARDAGFAFEPAGEAIRKEELSGLIEKLRLEKKRTGTVFVSGTGKRKTALQKLTEAAEEYLARMNRYENDLKIMGDRNSYAKTDHDATFMRMKEDHMGNGRLKPAYNVTLGADAEYISFVAVFQDRSDSGTLIPFMKRLEQSIRYKNVVTDAGYESEENYSFLEATGYSAFIKPSNYETSKTKKYRTDIGLRENMPYDKDADIHTCHMGYPLENIGIKKSKSKSGYPIETTIYECKSCAGCALKEKCIKSGGKLPVAERSKRLRVSKTVLGQRERALQRITSEQGILLRVNRSIQAEGAFGVLKQDMGFRRFLLRSKVKVRIEISLLCLAYNVKKLHNKIQSGRCGMYLHFPKAA